MNTRQLFRTDLPQTRSSCESLHIPVLFNGLKRYICDIHFGNDELCYLEENEGIPVNINMLRLITDERSKEEVRIEIKSKQKKFEILTKKIDRLRKEIFELKVELKNM